MIVREATPADLDYVEQHQRGSTRQDILDTARVHEKFWDLWPLKHSRRVWAIEAPDGACVAILGVCPLPDEPDVGFLWLAGSADLDRWQLGVVRSSSTWIEMIYRTDPWRKLRAMASANNPYSFKWATRWLGFKLVRTLKQDTAPWLEFYDIEHIPDAPSL